MSQNPNLQNDGFVTVRSKRNRTTRPNSKSAARAAPTNGDSDDFEFDQAALRKTLHRYTEELSQSDLYSSVLASLKEAFELLDAPQIEEIVCLGLGRVAERTVARYQLALLLCLQAEFGTRVSVQDPAFSRAEREFLADLNLTVIEGNREGKFRASEQGATIFYLPHCPRQLTNNVLWRNWGLQLRHCVLVCNSFGNVLESTSRRLLHESCEYVARVAPCAVELAVINTFKFFEVFNDTAVHVFPTHRLRLQPCEFWASRDEPHYIAGTAAAAELVVGQSA